jgi:hypothetical protein
MKEEEESVKKIAEGFVDVTGMYFGRRGSNDYSNRGIDINKVIDALGNEVKLVWKDEWTPIAPGIETGRANNKRTLRIHYEACPVRVRFRHYSEYVSYDSGDHNSYWEMFFWERYEKQDSP